MKEELKEYRATKTIFIGDAGQLIKGESILVGKYTAEFDGQTLQARPILGAIRRGWLVPVEQEDVVVPTRPEPKVMELSVKSAPVLRLPPDWGKIDHWRTKVSEIQKNVNNVELLQNIVRVEKAPAVIKAAEAKIAQLLAPPAPQVESVISDIEE